MCVSAQLRGGLVLIAYTGEKRTMVPTTLRATDVPRSPSSSALPPPFTHRGSNPTRDEKRTHTKR